MGFPSWPQVPRDPAPRLTICTKSPAAMDDGAGADFDARARTVCDLRAGHALGL